MRTIIQATDKNDFQILKDELAKRDVSIALQVNHKFRLTVRDLTDEDAAGLKEMGYSVKPDEQQNPENSLSPS